MQSLNDLLKTIFSGFKNSLKSINLNLEKTKANLENTKANLENTKASLENHINSSNNLKMDKNNPTGRGSFSLNRRYGSIIGDYSHAEGFNTTASGTGSHAEGEYTTALGIYSHAEGSHTKAVYDYQHVQGKYNMLNGSYADVIGNGTSPSKTSNAATVDWSGNAWYAGDVYVGSTSGTHKDEGSKKLATEEYVDNSAIVPTPSSADNGKILRVVDGKAIWVSLPSASGVSF